MINVKKLVPEVYFNRSRDFQLLCRIYEIVFNYLKTNQDTIYNNPLNDFSDSKLLDLLCITLGFEPKHEYNAAQLRGLCSVFIEAIRNKGSLTSINLILNMISNVEETEFNCYSEINSLNPYVLDVYIPLEVKDIKLIEDVLDYILPAGMSYTLIRQQVIKGSNIRTNYDVQSMVECSIGKDTFSGILRYSPDLESEDLDIDSNDYIDDTNAYTTVIGDVSLDDLLEAFKKEKE